MDGRPKVVLGSRHSAAQFLKCQTVLNTLMSRYRYHSSNMIYFFARKYVLHYNFVDSFAQCGVHCPVQSVHVLYAVLRLYSAETTEHSRGDAHVQHISETLLNNSKRFCARNDAPQSSFCSIMSRFSVLMRQQKCVLVRQHASALGTLPNRVWCRREVLRS